MVALHWRSPVCLCVFVCECAQLSCGFALTAVLHFQLPSDSTRRLSSIINCQVEIVLLSRDDPTPPEPQQVFTIVNWRDCNRQYCPPGEVAAERGVCLEIKEEKSIFVARIEMAFNRQKCEAQQHDCVSIRRGKKQTGVQGTRRSCWRLENEVGNYGSANVRWIF